MCDPLLRDRAHESGQSDVTVDRLREPASASGEPLPSRAGSIPPCRSRQQPCEGAIPGATVTPTSLAPGQERTFRSRAPGLDTALPTLTCTA